MSFGNKVKILNRKIFGGDPSGEGMYLEKERNKKG